MAAVADRHPPRMGHLPWLRLLSMCNAGAVGFIGANMLRVYIQTNQTGATVVCGVGLAGIATILVYLAVSRFWR